MTNEELVKKIKSGIDVQNNMGVLYEQNRGMIFKIVFPFSKMVDIDDLMQEAYFGLVKAVEKYDETREAMFITALGYYIKSAMRDFIQKSRQIRIPQHIIEKMSKFFSVVNKYQDATGEKPSDEYIMNELGITHRQFKSLQNTIHSFSVISFDDEIPNSDGLTIGESIADNSDVAEETIENIAKEKAKSDIWECVDTLDTKSKDLIYAVYMQGMTETAYADEKDLSTTAITNRMRGAYRVLKSMDKMKSAAETYGINNSLLYHDTLSFFKNNGMSAVEYVTMKKIEYEEGLKKLNKVFDSIAWGF